jgi:hypothetical protein
LAELVFRIVMSVQLQNGGDGILVESFYFWTSKLIIADTLIGLQTQTGANSSLSTWGHHIPMQQRHPALRNPAPYGPSTLARKPHSCGCAEVSMGNVHWNS